MLFFCANLLPKTVLKLTNILLLLCLIFALFFQLSFVFFLYFLGGFLGFLELSWEASVAKNRDKLGVFSGFEDYAYCLIYVSDDVLFLILPHHLADVLPNCYPKLLSKVIQNLPNQVGKNC